MTNHARVLWLLLGLVAACGDDSAVGGDAGATEDALPAKLDVGTELSWNPKITISSATAFDYMNSKSDTAFTASISGGTYTYEVADNGVATLTIDGKSADDGKLLSDLPATLVLQKTSASSVKIEIGDETFSGSILLPLPSSGGAGSGGGQPTEGVVPSGAKAATVNAAFVGSHQLQFAAAQPGAPFTAGDMKTFVIGADDTLTVDGTTISNPYELNGNKAAILWNDGKYSWELTDNSSGTFNEINVQDAKTNKWLGQWVDPSKLEGMTGGSDVNKEVKMSVSSSGGSGGATGPWAIGTEVIITWDGAEGLIISYMNAMTHPKYVGEDSMTDTMHVLKWTDGNEISRLTYLLSIDPDDKLLGIKGVNDLSQNGQKLSGSSEAVP